MFPQNENPPDIHNRSRPRFRNFSSLLRYLLRALGILPASPTKPLPTLTGMPASSPTVSSIPTLVVTELTSTPNPTDTSPATYTVQKGEYPYCIARRFNVNPSELLALNGLSDQQTFFTGTVLQLPQTGNPFPGQRVLQAHPTTYIVSRSSETIATIACGFGDVDPTAIAQVNNLSVDSPLVIGQQLNIP